MLCVDGWGDQCCWAMNSAFTFKDGLAISAWHMLTRYTRRLNDMDCSHNPVPAECSLSLCLDDVHMNSSPQL